MPFAAKSFDSRYLRLGRLLRRLREEAGLSSARLAELVAYDRSVILHAEGGTQSMSINALRKVCEALSARLEGQVLTPEALLLKVGIALDEYVSRRGWSAGRHSSRTAGGDVRYERILEVATATSVYDLHRLLSGLPYEYEISSALRAEIENSDSRATLYELCAELTIELWEAEPATAGLLTVPLSSSEGWDPRTSVVRKLEALCAATLTERDTGHVGTTGPLSVALALLELPDSFEDFLSFAIQDQQWRLADNERCEEYYGSAVAEVVAASRHLQDPLRRGLLRANDTGRLMVLTSQAINEDWSPGATERLISLLRASISVLRAEGRLDLANVATRFAASSGVPPV